MKSYFSRSGQGKGPTWSGQAARAHVTKGGRKGNFVFSKRGPLMAA